MRLASENYSQLAIKEWFAVHCRVNNGTWGDWVIGHGSNGSALDGSHGPRVLTYD